MARHFRLKEAERLLAELEGPLREAVALKQRHDEAQTEWRESSRRIMMLGGMDVEGSELLAQRGRRDALASRLRETVAAIQEHGCQVKDLYIGLLDFPTWFRGEEVLLCWRLGESGIQFWHGRQEGFRGRKPIDQEFFRQHRGDRPS